MEKEQKIRTGEEKEEQEQHEFCHPKKNICMGTRFHTGQRMLKALAESISSLVLLSQHNNAKGS